MSLPTKGRPRVSRVHSRLPAIPGMGHNYSSPHQPHNKRKTREIVKVPGQHFKRTCLLAELQALKSNVSVDPFLLDPTNDSGNTPREDPESTLPTLPTTPSPQRQKF